MSALTSKISNDSLLPLRNVEIGQRPLERFSSERDRFRESRMRMDGETDIARIRAHLDGKRNLADEFSGIWADETTADDAVCLRIEK